jgi:hypothetical protein
MALDRDARPIASLLSALSLRISREQLLASLCVVAFANGALLRAYDAVAMAGY